MANEISDDCAQWEDIVNDKRLRNEAFEATIEAFDDVVNNYVSSGIMNKNDNKIVLQHSRLIDHKWSDNGIFEFNVYWKKY